MCKRALTKLRRARVELLWQKAVISEALHGVSHRDDGHHDQPAPQDVQKAAHVYLRSFVPPVGQQVPDRSVQRTTSNWTPKTSAVRPAGDVAVVPFMQMTCLTHPTQLLRVIQQVITPKSRLLRF